jgi:phosphoribosyl 1,2-cyclic phosphate phosphodiesterase
LLIDGLRPRPHPSHQSISEAVEMVALISPRQAFLTHLAHSVAHADETHLLPQSVRFAQDGQRFVL